MSASPARPAATYDIAIAGLGAFGAAVAHEASSRGLRVLGIDRFAPPHGIGSSGGETRILRLAYAEDPTYVPLLRRSYEGWRSLQRESGRQLFVQCGGLMLGEAASELIEGVDRSAEIFDLDVESLDAAEVRSQFRHFDPSDGVVARYDPQAGFLRVATCLETFLERAEQAGASLLINTPIEGFSTSKDGGVLVRAGERTFEASHLIVTTGAWITELIRPLRELLDVRRQPVFWFEPETRAAARRDPVWIWEHQPRRIVYGLPDDGAGFKLAVHHEGQPTTAESVERAVNRADRAALATMTNRCLCQWPQRESRSEVCLYTNTPDGHFLIDRHPEHSRVLFASACSGHGFKFAPAVAEVLVDLAQERSPSVSIELFDLATLTRAGRARSRIRGGSAEFAGHVDR